MTCKIDASESQNQGKHTKTFIKIGKEGCIHMKFIEPLNICFWNNKWRWFRKHFNELGLRNIIGGRERLRIDLQSPSFLTREGSACEECRKSLCKLRGKNTASRNLWAFQLMITPCQGLSTAQRCACLYSHLWFLKSVMHSHCHGQYLGSQLHPAKDTYYLFPLFLALHWPVQHSHLRLVAVIMWNFVYCDTLHSVNQCYYSGYCLQDHCYS